LSILKKESSEGKLDKSVVEMVASNLDACWRASLLK